MKNDPTRRAIFSPRHRAALACLLAGFLLTPAAGQDPSPSQGSYVEQVDPNIPARPPAQRVGSVTTAEDTKDGAKLFTGYGCAACHGFDGRGRTGVGPALADNKALADADHTVTQILIGRGSMPSFAHVLTNRQIAALASYLRTVWGNDYGAVSAATVASARQSQPVRAALGDMQQSAASGTGSSASDGKTSEAETADGSKIYNTQGCSSCHGADGGGGVGPALSGDQDLADADHVIKQVLIGGGAMPAFAHKLSDAQIAAVASYVRTSLGNDFGQVGPQKVSATRQSQEVQQSLGDMNAKAQSGDADAKQSSSKAASERDGKQSRTSRTEGMDDTRAVAAAGLVHTPVTTLFPADIPYGPGIQNPDANDPDAAHRGMTYFNHFNCAGCHAPNGGGGMGPSLSNSTFIYGDSVEEIYLSILQGRPDGMPAWGGLLPDKTIWDLAAYIQSISREPKGQWGRTTSLPAFSIEQVPAERQDSVNPWQNTIPFSYGQNPFEMVQVPTK